MQQTPILQKIDEYKALLDRKEELAALTKENNADVEACRNELAELMIAEECTKVSRSGFTYSLASKTRYSKRAGADEQLMEMLRMNGLGSLIKETVNANTLQGAMSELAAENDDQLPEEWSEVINEYSYMDVQKRKEARR